jgi:hypothetical protein
MYLYVCIYVMALNIQDEGGFNKCPYSRRLANPTLSGALAHAPFIHTALHLLDVICCYYLFVVFFVIIL